MLTAALLIAALLLPFLLVYVFGLAVGYMTSKIGSPPRDKTAGGDKTSSDA